MDYTDPEVALNTLEPINGLAEMNARASDRRDAGNQFIPTNSVVFDWVDDSNGRGLWGAGEDFSGETSAPLDDPVQDNNPCPEGYRVPTPTEFSQMVKIVTNADLSLGGSGKVAKADLFDSNLKIVQNTQITEGGAHGADSDNRIALWTNMSQNANFSQASRFIITGANTAALNYYRRGSGYGVRCIRDVPLEQQK